MIYDKDNLIKILSYGQFGGLVSQDQYYVIVRYDDFAIQLRPEKDHIDFWIQTYKPGTEEPKQAWVEVSVPHPEYRTAYTSKCIRWVFQKILDQLTAEYKSHGQPR